MYIFTKKKEMNLSKSAFRRYKVIDGMLRNPMRKYPTMGEIIQACFDKLDFYPSHETIQKDMANMRLPYPDGFDAPVRYCGKNRGYEYTDSNYSLSGVSLRQDELDTIRESVELIGSIGGSRISEQFNHAVEKLLSSTMERSQPEKDKRPIVQTMVPPTSRGFQHFDLFYTACREKNPVSFLHFSYRKRTFSHHLIHPFLIKEFENRWYVLGYSESHACIRTFGMDRISDPFRITKRFQQTNPTEIDTYLHDVYGVFPVPGAEKEQISIRVSSMGTHYFQAYPLHESQIIKKNPSGTSKISFDLIPSIELARYFLSQGRHVQILAPSWFKKFTQDLTE